jgi:uncharacterized protein (TIGR00162 family)
MKKTLIIENEKIEPHKPILIEGLPGKGLVGKIVVDYIVKHLKAKKNATLYSPHFAYYVMVDKTGSLRLLRSEFYYWKNPQGGNDLVLLTGDGQAQTVEGQYEVANLILDYAQSNNTEYVFTIGGYQKEVQNIPQVLVSATDRNLLEKILQAGAKESPSGNPIIGIAGLLVGLAKFRKIRSACFLVETPGYLPDPKAAKSVLKVLLKVLDIKIDLLDLDEEISKTESIQKSMSKMQKQRKISAKRKRRIEEEKITYIS